MSNKKVNKSLILTILILILVITFIVFRLSKNNNINKKINSIHPTIMTLEKEIIVSGVIIPEKKLEIKSSMTGAIDEIYVKVGDYVSKGDLLMKIKAITDPVTYDKLMKQYVSNKMIFEAEERNYRRSKSLHEKGIISTKDIEDSERKFLIAKLELETIIKEMNIYNEEKTTSSSIDPVIKSTSEGTILELPIKVGGSVSARNGYNEGSTVAIIANLNSLLFYGKILESDVSYLKLGQIIKLKTQISNKNTIEAKVNMISPIGTNEDGNAKFDFYAKIVLSDSLRKILKPGFTANASIITETYKDIITLNEKYLKFSNDTAWVDVIDSNNMIKRRMILTGFSDGINVHIKSGLEINEKIKE